jgi:hypothetical protein
VGLLEQGAKEWYSNKELYEMMVALSKGLESTNAELAKTQVLIRDYNGLREKVEKCEKALSEGAGKTTGYKDMWGWIVAAITLLFMILSKVKL